MMDMKWFKQLITKEAIPESLDRVRYTPTPLPSASLVLQSFSVQCFALYILGWSWYMRWKLFIGLVKIPCFHLMVYHSYHKIKGFFPTLFLIIESAVDAYLFGGWISFFESMNFYSFILPVDLFWLLSADEHCIYKHGSLKQKAIKLHLFKCGRCCGKYKMKSFWKIGWSYWIINFNYVATY